jgi:hypothetical protein
MDCYGHLFKGAHEELARTLDEEMGEARG